MKSLNELFDRPVEWKWTNATPNAMAEFNIGQYQYKLSFDIWRADRGGGGDEYDVTLELFINGKSEFDVIKTKTAFSTYATCINIIEDFINNHNVSALHLEGYTKEQAKLYHAIAKKLANKFPQFSISYENGGYGMRSGVYLLLKESEELDEENLDEEELDEETYKEIVRDITNNNVPGAILHNLPHRDWSPLIKYVKYVDHDQGIFKFFVPNTMNGWFTYIQFVDWDHVVCDESFNPNEAARVLLWVGNIRVHCPCPAYKFWGHQYVMTQKDAAIIPELRFPSIRNPHLHGGCCKHLRKTLKVLPFHLGTIAKEIKLARKLGQCALPIPPANIDGVQHEPVIELDPKPEI